MSIPFTFIWGPPGNVSFRIFLWRPVWLPRFGIVLHSISLTKIVRPKGTREREEVRKTLKYLDSNNEPFKFQVKMNDQVFQWSGLGAQIVVRSVHIVRSIVVTISVFIFHCTLFLLISLGPRKNVVFIWFHCQQDGYLISAHPFILGYEENRLQGEG